MSRFGRGQPPAPLLAGRVPLFPIGSDVSGTAAFAAMSASGGIAPTPGIATAQALSNWSGMLLTAQLIANVVAIRISDLALLATWTNQTTDGSTGDLAVSSVALIPTTVIMLVGFSADGSASFRRAVTVA